MKNLAPQIFRKRMLLEGYFTIEVAEQTLIDFFTYITAALKLKTYGNPIVHTTGGIGKDSNQGYDAFIPLIDSGIYIAVWSKQKFLSMVIYTCKEFEESTALRNTVDFFKMPEAESKLF